MAVGFHQQAPLGQSYKEFYQKKEKGKIIKGVYRHDKWNLKHTPFNLPPEIINLIKEIYIPNNPEAINKPSWKNSSTGLFSTGLAYWLIRNNKISNVESEKPFKWIWQLLCSNKIKIFLWLCKYNRIPTCSYLNSVGLYINPSYYTCGRQETIEHIFLTVGKL